MQSNKPLMIGVSVVILLLAAGLLYFFTFKVTPTSQVPDSAYFLDLSTGKLFKGKLEDAGPLEVESGAKLPDGQPAGVRAAVFSCGSCDSEADRYVGYVSILPPEERTKPAVRRMANAEQLAAIPELGKPALDVKWHARTSEEGVKITDAATRKCGEGKTPTPCAPSYIKR